MTNFRYAKVGDLMITHLELSGDEEEPRTNATVTGYYLCGYFCQECGKFNVDVVKLECFNVRVRFWPKGKDEDQNWLDPEQEQEIKKLWFGFYEGCCKGVNERNEKWEEIKEGGTCSQCRCVQTWAGVRSYWLAKVFDRFAVVVAVLLYLISGLAMAMGGIGGWLTISVPCALLTLKSVEIYNAIYAFINRMRCRRLYKQASKHFSQQQLKKIFPYLYRPGDNVDLEDERAKRLVEMLEAE